MLWDLLEANLDHVPELIAFYRGTEFWVSELGTQEFTKRSRFIDDLWLAGRFLFFLFAIEATDFISQDLKQPTSYRRLVAKFMVCSKRFDQDLLH